MLLGCPLVMDEDEAMSASAGREAASDCLRSRSCFWAFSSWMRCVVPASSRSAATREISPRRSASCAARVALAACTDSSPVCFDDVRDGTANPPFAPAPPPPPPSAIDLLALLGALAARLPWAISDGGDGIGSLRSAPSTCPRALGLREFEFEAERCLRNDGLLGLLDRSSPLRPDPTPDVLGKLLLPLYDFDRLGECGPFPALPDTDERGTFLLDNRLFLSASSSLIRLLVDFPREGLSAMMGRRPTESADVMLGLFVRPGITLTLPNISVGPVISTAVPGSTLDWFLPGDCAVACNEFDRRGTGMGGGNEFRFVLREAVRGLLLLLGLPSSTVGSSPLSRYLSATTTVSFICGEKNEGASPVGADRGVVEREVVE